MDGFSISLVKLRKKHFIYSTSIILDKLLVMILITCILYRHRIISLIAYIFAYSLFSESRGINRFCSFVLTYTGWNLFTRFHWKWYNTVYKIYVLITAVHLHRARSLKTFIKHARQACWRRVDIGDACEFCVNSSLVIYNTSWYPPCLFVFYYYSVVQ